MIHEPVRTIEVSDAGALAVTPLVSVHMLAYRHEAYIDQAIRSVVEQRVDFPFELIVAEDCSPDGTLDIALRWQRLYPRIVRVLHGAANVGMQANIQRCIDATRGRFIAVCEGDDYWCDAEKLARQVSVLEADAGCTLVFHPAKTLDVDSGRWGSTGRRSLYSRMMSLQEIVLGDGGFMPSAAMMFRTDAVHPLAAWAAGAPVGDYASVLQAAARGSVAYIDRVMSVYRTNVAHSWSQRHAMTLGYRIEHARRIETMFRGFIAEAGSAAARPAARMISKYYSDPIVRLPAQRSERREAYDTVHDKLLGGDRVLAWISARTGIRLVAVKDLLRKFRSLTRSFLAHLSQRRIDA